MDVLFFVAIVKLLVLASLIAAAPLFVYFEIVYLLRGNITNPAGRGIVMGLIWGILFMSYTVHESSAVGSAMAAPVIIIGFPMVGLMIGSFYEKRNKPLIGRKRYRNT